MLTQNALDEKILKLSKQGKSRKAIAQQLGVSEWRVRCCIREEKTRQLYAHQLGNTNSGSLRLAKVKKTQKKGKKALILSDIHIPYHHQKNLACALAYAKDLQPDDFVLNGDVADMYDLSKYVKDPAKLHTANDEIVETREFLAYTNEILPKANKVFIGGNHEQRNYKLLLNDAAGLCTLPELSLENLLKTEEYGYKYIDYGNTFNLGNLEITHGSVVRRHSGASAKAHHEKTGGSVLIGHIHRQGSYFVTNKWGIHVAIENGHLCDDSSVEYTQNPNWQAGFTEVEYYDDGFFTFRQHQCNNGTLIVDGVKYEA